jgi:hypothetical protein
MWQLLQRISNSDLLCSSGIVDASLGICDIALYTTHDRPVCIARLHIKRATYLDPLCKCIVDVRESADEERNETQYHTLAADAIKRTLTHLVNGQRLVHVPDEAS